MRQWPAQSPARDHGCLVFCAPPTMGTRPLACEVVACAAFAARDCLRVRSPMACEAVACAASAAHGCLRVRPLLDVAASVCDSRLMRLSPTLD
ncbi:hypothetical protein BHE74_00045662 [Ensete ventricosum]|nr:hypothetical protein GW17_00055351 [Ensete ventricosum]RWW48283.1 hypothetical protein BHE74_00045662 [Ensete ventricosum]RZR98106.1 hypothetical protein BHM03_00027412 [Ensete ventricosum]